MKSKSKIVWLNKINNDLNITIFNFSKRLKVLVQRFLEDRDTEATLKIGADMRKINFCFRYLKELYLSQSNKASKSTATGASGQQQQPNVTVLESSFYDSKETKDLKDTLKQRDNEISKKNRKIS